MENAAPLQQSPEFADALTSIGRPPLQRDGHVLMRRTFCGIPAYMASRVSLTGPQSLAALPRNPLILAPDHPAPWLFTAGAWPLMTPATVAEIDLTISKDRLLENQHQKWRNRLRHGIKQRLQISQTPMPNDINHWLYRAETTSQNRNGYRNYPLNLIQALSRPGPDHSRLFTAQQGGEHLAAMLFLRHGQTATYMIGHSTETGRRLSAHTLLLWQAVLWLRKNGYNRLDLGIIDTSHSPGLARFKLGSGARARPLGGTWLLLPGLTRPARLIAGWDRSLFPTPP